MGEFPDLSVSDTPASRCVSDSITHQKLWSQVRYGLRLTHPTGVTSLN
ncbi:MAG: hypothetical protein V7K98_15050 [Nostoc sp.]